MLFLQIGGAIEVFKCNMSSNQTPFIANFTGIVAESFALPVSIQESVRRKIIAEHFIRYTYTI